MPLGKNFRRPQIFSVEISGPKWSYFVNFRSIRCTGQSGPLSAPGPVTSASSASWMIRPCCNPQKATLCAKTCHTTYRSFHPFFAQLTILPNCQNSTLHNAFQPVRHPKSSLSVEALTLPCNVFPGPT